MNTIHSVFTLPFTLALLLLNFAGFAALAQRCLPTAAWDRQIARAAALLTLCLFLFFVEHFSGLGSLKGLGALSTLASIALLNRRLLNLDYLKGELPFVLPFLFALAWRYAYPDINDHSEHLTDLYFISNYLSGDTLPPPDRWLPGYRFDNYYGFLHYAVALLGRMLGLNPGMAMNLGGALAFGLIGSLGWSVVSRGVHNKMWPRVLVVAALLSGGTGVAPLLLPLFPGDATIQMWANTRFIGLYDQELKTPLGQALFPKTEPLTPGFEARELPLETPSYLLYLGDVHPPLAGFALLLFTLALLARMEKFQEQKEEALQNTRPLFFMLGLTLPLPLILNTWVLPTQVLLLTGWVIYRWRGRLTLHMRYMALGLAASALLIYPFLSYFASNALVTPLVLTQAQDHTPWRQGLAIWWPVLWLVVLSLLQGRRQRLSWWSAWGVIALWLLCEFITVDDPNAERFQRFNTVLKWGSWLWVAALVWLSTVQLASVQRWRRALTLVPLLAVLTYLLPQAHYGYSTPRPHAGQLKGDAWLQDDLAQRAILDWLRNAARGLVLESVEQGAYSPTSAFALHSGQASAMGWPDHVAQWRGSPAFIAARVQMIREVYRGTRADAASWLKSLNVQYVVWSRFDAARGAEALAQLKSQLAQDYEWLPLWSNGGEEYGVFRRLP